MLTALLMSKAKECSAVEMVWPAGVHDHAAANLKAVGRAGVGIDNMEVAAAKLWTGRNVRIMINMGRVGWPALPRRQKTS